MTRVLLVVLSLCSVLQQELMAQTVVTKAEPQVIVIVPDALRPKPEELMDEAQASFKTKNYVRAVQLYGDVLRFYPEYHGLDQALYQMAECYRALGRFEDARSAIKKLQERFTQSTWLEPAILIQAEMLATEGDWKATVQTLQPLLKSAPSGLVLRTHALHALAHEQMQSLASAENSLRLLVESSHPQRAWALIKLATLEAEQGKSDSALKRLDMALKDAQSPQYIAEASVRAGNLVQQKKQYTQAIAYYRRATSSDMPEAWKKLAHAGIVQASFANKDYQAVVEEFSNSSSSFPKAMQDQMLFLFAEAHRLLNNHDEAITAYERLIKQYPKSPATEPSAWARLLLLQTTDSLIPETASFIARFPNSQRLPLAKLMRADAYFEKKEFATAKKMYDDLMKASAPPHEDVAVMAGVYFRWGYATYETKDYQHAIPIFQTFLQNYSLHPLVSSVLWMQSQSLLATQNKQGARQAVDRLLKEHPKSSLREMALWFSATLEIEAQNSALAQQRLEALLKEFPATNHSADAHALLGGIHFQNQNAKASRTHWLEARRRDSKKHELSATQQLVAIALQQKNLNELLEETKRYDELCLKHPELAPLEPSVMEWIAQQLALAKRRDEAEGYYRRALAETTLAEQRQRVHLALCLLLSEVRNWGAAEREWENFRRLYPQEANRSAVLEKLAEAHIGTGRFADAEALAEQILKQNPEGEFNARGRLLLGDSAFAQLRYHDAAKIYSAVAVLIDHPELTPLAKQKAEESRRRVALPTPKPSS